MNTREESGKLKKKERQTVRGRNEKKVREMRGKGKKMLKKHLEPLERSSHEQSSDSQFLIPIIYRISG